MTFKVTLSPSARTFDIESGESLLDAALRAGCTPNYGCNSGSCGLCSAVVRTGEVRRIQHSDYVPDAIAKQRGEILMCCFTAASDLLLQTSEAQSSQDLPVQNIRVRVRKVERVSEDASLISLQTPRTQTLRFLAGQYLRVMLEGYTLGEFYIASCPCDDRNLQLHIANNRIFNGRDLLDQLKESQYLDIQAPFGEFSLVENPQLPILFIAYADGFAPIQSLIEHAIALDYQAPVSLVRFGVNSPVPYLNNICRSWADALDDFKYSYVNLESVDEAPNVLSQPSLYQRFSIPMSIYAAGSDKFIQLLLANKTRLFGADLLRSAIIY